MYQANKKMFRQRGPENLQTRTRKCMNDVFDLFIDELVSTGILHVSMSNAPIPKSIVS